MAWAAVTRILPGGRRAGRAPVFWNSATLVLQSSRPYMSESGVGGQPGT